MEGNSRAKNRCGFSIGWCSIVQALELSGPWLLCMHHNIVLSVFVNFGIWQSHVLNGSHSHREEEELFLCLYYFVMIDHLLKSMAVVLRNAAWHGLDIG